MTRPTPPGWHPSPSGAQGKRFWNGTGGTAEDAAPPTTPVGPRWAAGDSGPNHGLHLAVTICTCGLWLPVWLTVTLLDYHRTRVGPEPGLRGFMTAHPLLTGIGVLAILILMLTDWKAFLLLASLVAIATGLVMLATLALRSWQRRRREKAAIAARADDQHEALLNGDDQWGVFGIQPAAEPFVQPPPRPEILNRPLLVAGVAVVAGIIAFTVMATIDTTRSADRTPRPVSAPVTTTHPVSRPIPHSLNPAPAVDIPFPFIPAPPSRSSRSIQPAAPPVRIGQHAVDGNITFVVTSVDRSKTVANPSVPEMQTSARGTFLTAQLTITNNGKQPEAFVALYQKLRINSGVYDVDPAAALWTLTLETVVSPGATVTAALTFDVPANTPAGGMLELHGAAHSGGATVELLPPQ